MLNIKITQLIDNKELNQHFCQQFLHIIGESDERLNEQCKKPYDKTQKPPQDPRRI
jgi:hypothetical protein